MSTSLDTYISPLEGTAVAPHKLVYNETIENLDMEFIEEYQELTPAEYEYIERHLQVFLSDPIGPTSILDLDNYKDTGIIDDTDTDSDSDDRYSGNDLSSHHGDDFNDVMNLITAKLDFNRQT